METTRIIEQYLDNTLSGEERIMVESRVASDKDFRELVNLHKEVNESISDSELFHLHQLLEKISAEQAGLATSRSKGKSLKTGRMIQIAALLLIVAGAAVVIRLIAFKDPDTRKLFNQYYESYEADIVSRSDASDTLDLAKAIELYSISDFASSLSTLNVILAEDKENYPAWFFRGLVQMELNDMPEAIYSFNRIPDTWEGVYREHVDWYLALALLYKGDTEGAANRFDKINASGGYYAAKAERILIRLRK